MVKYALTFAISVLAAMAGCGDKNATPPAVTAALTQPPCTPETQVNVKQDAASASVFKFTPEPAKIPASGSAGVRWKLANGFSFRAADGIVFKSAAPAGSASSPANGADEYRWCFNSNGTSVSSQYGANILIAPPPASGSPGWHCDPTIINSDAAIDVSTAASVEVTCTPL